MADDEQLCKYHIIGDGGEAEEESSQSPPEKKRKLDEKGDGAEDEDEGDESDGTEEDDGEDGVPRSEHDPGSDSGGYFWIGHRRIPNILKSDYLPDGVDGVEEVDVDTWNKYYQEIEESGGFDIDHFPGDCDMANYRPRNVNTVPQAVLDSCVAAINEFNQKDGTDYSFGKLEKANARLWDSGANYYLTFQAKDSAADASKTFQALVWWGWDIDSLGSPSAVLKFCRLKEAAAATCSLYAAVLSMSS